MYRFFLYFLSTLLFVPFSVTYRLLFPAVCFPFPKTLLNSLKDCILYVVDLIRYGVVDGNFINRIRKLIL